MIPYFIGVSSDASRPCERILGKALDQRIVPRGMCFRLGLYHPIPVFIGFAVNNSPHVEPRRCIAFSL
jgi:hypothetical protein